jgi:hypothetical protein
MLSISTLYVPPCWIHSYVEYKILSFTDEFFSILLEFCYKYPYYIIILHKNFRIISSFHKYHLFAWLLIFFRLMARFSLKMFTNRRSRSNSRSINIQPLISSTKNKDNDRWVYTTRFSYKDSNINNFSEKPDIHISHSPNMTSLKRPRIGM